MLSGEGPRYFGDLSQSLGLLHLGLEPCGEDVLIEAYLREP